MLSCPLLVGLLLQVRLKQRYHVLCAAESYHAHVISLGLTSLVPQLAALCPDEDKRTALVAAHKRYLEAEQQPAAGGRGWVPPEAAMAALQELKQSGSWACERCTLVNAPSSKSCEVCSAPRPKAPRATAVKVSSGGSSNAGSSRSAAAPPASQWSVAVAASPPPAPQERPQAAPAPAVQSAPPAGVNNWPTLGGASSGSSRTAATEQVQPESSSSEHSSLQGGKKKKPQKQSLQQLLSSGKSHPQNAWSQQQRLSQVTQAPASASQQTSLGQWGKSGGAKLAKKISAVNDAWSR